MLNIRLKQGSLYKIDSLQNKDLGIVTVLLFENMK